MGITINISTVRERLHEMNRELKNNKDKIDRQRSLGTSFAEDNNYTGKGYIGIKNYFTAVQVSIQKGIICFCDEAIKANIKYDRELEAYFGGLCRIDEDDLKEKIDNIRSLENELEAVSIMDTAKDGVLGSMKNGRQTLQKLLDDLYRFNDETGSIYNESRKLMYKIKQGAACAETVSVNRKTGQYILGPVDLEWKNEIDRAWTENQYKITRPPGMTDDQYTKYKDKIYDQVEYLEKNGKWDKAALTAYVNEINKLYKESDETYSSRADRVFKESKLVGSGVYKKMFDACEYSNKDKADMVMDQLGGKIDKNGMLQLKGDFKLYPNMPPHDSFYDKFAVCVTKGYPDGLTKDAANGDKDVENDMKRLHQFRMYIDRNNIDYVRNNFKKDGMTDEDALKVYVNASKADGGLGGEKLIIGGARLHNKYPQRKSYRTYVKKKENKKRMTNNSHAEFIIDPDGKFISQWDVLEQKKDGTMISDPDYYKRKYAGNKNGWVDFQKHMADTESFNYAVGKGDSYKKQHVKFDMDPPKDFDTDLRNEALKGWESPSKDVYDYKSDDGDDYSTVKE